MNIDVIARAEQDKARQTWSDETLPKLIRERVFETLAEETCKRLGYGALRCSMPDTAAQSGSFNICHFVEFEGDAAVLDRMPARGRWAIRMPLPENPHIREKFDTEVAALQ